MGGPVCLHAGLDDRRHTYVGLESSDSASEGLDIVASGHAKLAFAIQTKFQKTALSSSQGGLVISSMLSMVAHPIR
ncbi:hypothetical protein B6S44_19575 [Bosea sp. Tri-44]|nr:hypothetical protein B6S44_19575 [Bosea sp. Tri-44]